MRTKQFIIDFETYSEELQAEERRGIKKGVAEAGRLILELLAGASVGDLGIDDEFFLKFVEEIDQGIDVAFRTRRGDSLSECSESEK